MCTHRRADHTSWPGKEIQVEWRGITGLVTIKVAVHPKINLSYISTHPEHYLTIRIVMLRFKKCSGSDSAHPDTMDLNRVKVCGAQVPKIDTRKI